MTPAELCKSNSEHGHQRALFAWANIAEAVGFSLAWDERTYSKGSMLQFMEGGVNRHIAYPVPELKWMHAIPNGGLRDKRTAAVLKAEGVKRGIPDIFLPLPCHAYGTEPAGYMQLDYAGLYVELKRPETTKQGVRKASIIDQQAGATSDEQDEALAHLRAMGYAVGVYWSWDEAAKAIQAYIEMTRRNA